MLGSVLNYETRSVCLHFELTHTFVGPNLSGNRKAQLQDKLAAAHIVPGMLCNVKCIVCIVF